MSITFAEETVRNGGSDPAVAMREMVGSLEAQLASLYEERSQPSAEARMVESLEAQVRALLDEKQELAEALAARDAALARVQGRARALAGVLVDAALATA